MKKEVRVLAKGGIASLLTIAQALFSQTAPPQTPPAGTVRGRILDADTDMPVSSRLHVAVQSVGDARSVPKATDGIGSYVLNDLKTGVYNLVVTQPDNRFRIGSRRIDMKPGTELDADIYVRLYGAIQGAVTDPDGAPVLGARVLLISMDYVAGQLSYYPDDSKTTDDRGAYSFVSRVQTGHPYLLLALPPRNEAPAPTTRNAISGQSPELLRPVWFPGPPAIGGSAHFVLSSGETRRVDIRLTAGPSHCLDGKLTADGPVSSVATEIAIQETSGYAPDNGGILKAGVLQSFKADADGSFSVCRLWPGQFRLAGSSPDGRYGETIVTVGNADVHDVRLTIRSPVPIRGDVLFWPALSSAEEFRAKLQKSNPRVVFMPWSRHLFLGEPPLNSYRLKAGRIDYD